MLTGVLPGAPRILGPSLPGDGWWWLGGVFYGVTERRDSAWCLPRGGPRRGPVNEQISAPSGLPALFMGKQEGRQGAEILPSAWGRMDGGHWGKEGWAPVQRNGEVQEGGHQLGGVVPGQQGDGLQGIFLGLGDADGAELQVDGPAQAGNLCGEEEYGERAGLGRGPGPAQGSLNREAGAAPMGVEPLQVECSPEGDAQPCPGGSKREV